MINNNPYNLPDRMPQKQTRLYTETGSHYRNDSIENVIPILNPPSGRLMSNMIMKRSAINVEEIPHNIRSPPYYGAVKNQVKHYIQSPKHHNSSACGSLNSFSSQSSVLENNVKGQMRESFGKTLDFHEMNQKIQVLAISMKNNEKRILDLERNVCNSPFMVNLSKISDHHQQMSELTKADIYQQMATKYEQETSQNMKKLKDDILSVRQQIKMCLKNNDLDRLMKQLKAQDKIENKQHHEGRSQYKIVKEMEQLKMQMDDRIKKSHQFMISIVARLQKELQSGLTSPPYKSSGIKCTGTAVLLRFVQSFKVRKNNIIHHHTPNKNNSEIKITILDNTYYVDSEGYLLDKDQFYLVDSRGMQVKLEEKHIRLLREENVFI